MIELAICVAVGQSRSVGTTIIIRQFSVDWVRGLMPTNDGPDMQPHGRSRILQWRGRSGNFK